MLIKLQNWVKEHPYVWMLSYWILYLIYFFLLETFSVPTYILHSTVDDYIPFMEIFILPYILWFPMLVISQAYFLFSKYKHEFQNLCFMMFAGMTFCLFVYTILPNGLNLRVQTYPDNLLANIVQFLQGVDTPTNVCPSIHVSTTLAIFLAVMRYPHFQHPKSIKIVTTILSISIILSTMFLKQHSFLDVIAGILVTLILYPITYHSNWRSCFSHTPIHKIIE